MQDYSETLTYANDTVLLPGKWADQLEVDSFIALNMVEKYSHKNNLVVNENKT